jgi:hypothetical protein
MKVNKLITFSANNKGFSIIEAKLLRANFLRLIKNDVADKIGTYASSETEIAKQILENFEIFKAKENRMFSKKSAGLAIGMLKEDPNFNLRETDFITDEENLGYSNLYWRCVRANASGDVGSIHADKWFWDLGHGSIPKGYTRVKTWIPLLQEPGVCGLQILPRSHLENFDYDYKIGNDGKKRPQLINEAGIKHRMQSAGVDVGSAIIFNDRLLHGGISTGSLRISIEWTTCLKTS